MKKILGLTLVTMLGCGPGKNTTDTEGGSSGGSTGEATGTNGGSTSGPTSGNATDNSGTGTGGVSDATSGGVDVTGSGGGLTTGGEPTGGGTTGGGGDAVMAECQAICDSATACMLDPEPTCVLDCVNEFAGAMGECELAIEAYLGCISGMACVELIDLFVNDNPGPCADQATATEVACGLGGDCTTGVGSNPQGTECSVSTDCPDQPTIEMQCNEAECVCLVDGMQVATCPSDMVCKTVDQIEAKAADCCGF
mgnify:CR=1 FL=1